MPAILIATFAGAASAFAFAPVGLWPVMPLAIAALCELVWRARSLRQSLATGWAFGVGQFAIGLNWIATAFTYQAAMPAWLGWIAVVLLSLYLAIYPAIATGLAWRFKGNRPLALVLSLAGAWALAEWLRGTMFTGFPWNPLGATLDDTPWLRVAPYLGTYSLSLLVVLAGGAIWLIASRRWQAGVAIAAALGLLLLLPPVGVPGPCCTTLLGVSDKPPTQAPAPPLPGRAPPAAQGLRLPEQPWGRPIRVVQPNIGQEDKWRPGFSDEA
ncbi:MAG TPA: hypothetical protein VF757_04675, partial [Sphingomicrobium sp.]